MAQWVNRLRNNIFVNTPPLPLSCEISGALYLAQPGLTAGWLAGRLTIDTRHNIGIGNATRNIYFRKPMRVSLEIEKWAATLTATCVAN